MQFDLAILKEAHNCNPKNLFDISTCDRLIQQKNNHSSLETLENDYLGYGKQ